MSKIIHFATSNKNKIAEANLACKEFDIQVVQMVLNIDEIQNSDPLVIANRKIDDAYIQAKRPVVVTDTFWKIPALNGFPGGYMKEVSKWFTADDFIRLIKDKTDKRISFTESIYYKDENTKEVFSKEYWGEMSLEPRGSSDVSIERVAIFNGNTLAEKHEMGIFSHKTEDYIWYKFAKWFAAK